MDSNQNQQFLGNPSIYPHMDPLTIEHFLRRYQLGHNNLLNAQVNYNQLLYSNRNGLPNLQQEIENYRRKFNKSPTYTPLGKKRKALEGNDCECSEFENKQRMVKIPKVNDNPINLALNSNTRQGNMMVAAKSSTLRQTDYAVNSRGNNPINNALDIEYQNFVAALRRPPSPGAENREYREFPKRFDDKMILGPYATEVDLAAYRTINFQSPKIATRQLLVLVFPSHILATHSLTGKPSPVWYGRKNIIKMQLDTAKVADIIHCVLSETNCNRQDIRAAITAKCCETARLFKNRSIRNTI